MKSKWISRKSWSNCRRKKVVAEKIIEMFCIQEKNKLRDLNRKKRRKIDPKTTEKSQKNLINASPCPYLRTWDPAELYPDSAYVPYLLPVLLYLRPLLLFVLCFSPAFQPLGNPLLLSEPYPVLTFDKVYIYKLIRYVCNKLIQSEAYDKLIKYLFPTKWINQIIGILQ